MGSVMIRCPATGRAISTGITADRASFARKPVFMARSYCRFCSAEHEWFAQEAWVDEPARRVEAEPAEAA